MAYNQYREWDRGKEAWNDNGAWDGNRGNVRGRDEDYYNDGKRRKFNNGGYDASYSYDESGYDGASGQYSKQSDWTQEFPPDDRGGQRGTAAGAFGPKKRMQPSEPSQHVIFLGLDPDFTEADLQAYLTSYGCSVETVTVIRERSSGVSKGFGFAQFSSTEHARAFVDPQYPFVQVPPPASHGATATAAFYKALESGAPHNGRRVKIDYSQSASPHEKGRQAKQNANDGTRDIGNSQGPVLLFRGLDPLSGPQAINQAIRNSAGAGKDGSKGMKRIVLVKDKVTMASFGFAFVEFVDVEASSRVLAATMSPQIHPNGFRISDKPVAASFAHPDSFQPINPMSRDEASLPSSLAMGGVDGGWARYWDETSTIAMLEFKVEEPVKQASAPATKEKEKKKKPKVADPSANVIAAPSTLPVSDKPVTLSFSKGPAKAGLGASVISKPIALGFSEDNGADSQGEDDTAGTEDIAKTAKKVAPLIASKKTASNINKWNQVQEELSGTDPAAAPKVQEAAGTPPVTVATATATATPAGSTPTKEIEFEFSDLATMACLLCARQFKTVEQLKRHNKESDLHKKNFQDGNLRDVARQKVLARLNGNKAEQPKYRDRASERRTLFNQPDAPVVEKETGKGPSKKRAIEGPPPPPSPPPPPVNPGKDESNVGNKLLKMMGWTEGTGLGTSGEGRVDPIQTAIYAQGAGLGASKGKEIGKYQEGYQGFVQKVQDTARERYNS